LSAYGDLANYQLPSESNPDKKSENLDISSASKLIEASPEAHDFNAITLRKPPITFDLRGDNDAFVG
jgi:hypothetical protein